MKKSDIKDYATANKYYEGCRRIRFGLDTDDPANIEDICQRLFINKESTVYMRGGHQCNQGKYRSIDDYLNLCKTYFPDTTTLQAMRVFNTYGEEKRLSIGYCGNIRKTNCHGQAYWRRLEQIDLGSGAYLNNVNEGNSVQ